MNDPLQPSPEAAQIAALVYQRCTQYDQYLPQLSVDVARAWAMTFQKHSLNAKDLIQAVDAVYAEKGNGYRPLPADIAHAARLIRKERTEAEPREVMEARQEALAAKAAEDLAELAERKGIPGPDKFVRRGPRAEETVKCPWCKAGIRKPCVIPGSDQKLKSGFHPSRKELALGTGGAA